jgi:hypothetical protein
MPARVCIVPAVSRNFFAGDLSGGLFDGIPCVVPGAFNMAVLHERSAAEVCSGAHAGRLRGARLRAVGPEVSRRCSRRVFISGSV